MCAKRRLKSVWSADQSIRCPHTVTLHHYLSKNAPGENSDQTARVRRLIWILSGRTCPKDVFWRRGRFVTLLQFICALHWITGLSCQFYFNTCFANYVKKRFKWEYIYLFIYFLLSEIWLLNRGRMKQVMQPLDRQECYYQANNNVAGIPIFTQWAHDVYTTH